MIRLDLTHELAPRRRWVEIPFDNNASISDVIQKTARQTGSNPATIRLELRKPNGSKTILKVGETLQIYDVIAGDVIHVYDDDPDSIVAALEQEQTIRKVKTIIKFFQLSTACPTKNTPKGQATPRSF